MTDHAQVLREYVDSVMALEILFGLDRSKSVNFNEVSVAIQRDVLGAGAAYVASLKEQGLAVPGGL